MTTGQKERHRLFQVAIKATENLKQRISLFRTEEEKFIQVDVYKNGREPTVCISITRKNNQVGIEIKEFYYLRLESGQCEVSVTAYIRSSTGEAVHTLNEAKTYTREQTLGSKSWPWLRIQLDTLTQWLENPNTTRVSPKAVLVRK